MNVSFQRSLCLAWCLIAAWPVAVNAEPTPPPSPSALSPGAVADFEWFGTLGFPDVHGCPAARVATGGWSESPGEAPEEYFITAFLLRHEDNGSFTVFSPDLSIRNYKTTKTADTPTYQRVGYEEVPLAEVADVCLDAWRHLSKDDNAAFVRLFDGRWPGRSELFVWAWGCWRNGLDERAARLYTMASGTSGDLPSETQAATFRERLEQDFGSWLFDRAVRESGEPTISRSRLLEDFARIPRDFPACRDANRAREMAERLRTMIAEGAARSGQPSPPLGNMPVEQRVAELLFRLCNQTGQRNRRGLRGIFDPIPSATDPGKTDPSPAAQLAALGTAAVPPLIIALDDKRPTRLLEPGYKIFDSPYVLTVGMCVREILRRIAGEGAYHAWIIASEHVRDDRDAAFKTQVENWWRDVEKKGERQVLIDAASLGGYEALDQARVLRNRFPDTPLEVFIRGTKNSQNNSDRARFVGLVNGIPGDEPVPFLEEELRDGTFLGERVAAAWALWLRNRRDEATVAMIREWEKLPPERPLTDEHIHYTYEPEELIGFLVDCGRVDAIEALRRDLRQQPVERRRTVVSALGLHRSSGDLFSSGRSNVMTKNFDNELNQPPGEEVKSAIEALLADELEDVEEFRKTEVNRMGKMFPLSRVCDLAGETLAARFKEKYVFGLDGTRRERDRRRIACLNVWRGEHGQPALPLPSRHPVEPAPTEETLPLLRALVAAKTESECQAAAGKVTKMGLPALPSLTKFVSALPPDDPARVRLTGVEHSLANRVTEVILANPPVGGAEWRSEIQTRLDALEERPLTPAEFADLSVEMADKLPPDVGSFELSAERENDLGGVRIAAMPDAVRRSDRRRVGEPNGIVLHVELSGKSLHAWNTTGDFKYARKTKDFEDFLAAAERALAAETTQPFSWTITVGAYAD